MISSSSSASPAPLSAGAHAQHTHTHTHTHTYTRAHTHTRSHCLHYPPSWTEIFCRGNTVFTLFIEKKKRKKKAFGRMVFLFESLIYVLCLFPTVGPHTCKGAEQSLRIKIKNNRPFMLTQMLVRTQDSNSPISI